MAEKPKGILQETAEAYALLGIPYEGFVEGNGYQSLMAQTLGSCYFQERGCAIPQFEEVMDSSPEMRTQSVGYQHKVQTGDTLTSISQHYGITPASIMSANPGIDWHNARNSGELIFVGETLALPKGTTEEQLPKDPPVDIVLPSSANMVRTMMEGRGAANGGGSNGDGLLIELNFKFGVGHEKSFNLAGFGVKSKASATMDYMTFRLTENGFQYIPYRKATIEGSYGHAVLNGGVKMDYDGYRSQWSGNGTIANFELSTSQAPMITPISFGYQMPLGFGVDFKFGIDMNAGFESFNRLDRVHRQVTGVGIWYGPKY